MIHISSIVAFLWFYRTFYTETAYRTDVAGCTILWIALFSTSLTEVSFRAIATHTNEASFTTKLPWITAHTIFNSCLAPTWLVRSLGALHWSWCPCGTVTAIWTLCSKWLI